MVAKNTQTLRIQSAFLSSPTHWHFDNACESSVFVHLHLESLPVSQSNWQCFQGMPRWAICGALIRADKRASHRKPPGITHGSSKPQDVTNGWIAEPSGGVQRGPGENRGRGRESGKERTTGRMDAQRRKWKQGCGWRGWGEEVRVMQGEILLNVSLHREDKKE